jgi:hypothetical protein
MWPATDRERNVARNALHEDSMLGQSVADKAILGPIAIWLRNSQTQGGAAWNCVTRFQTAPISLALLSYPVLRYG